MVKKYNDIEVKNNMNVEVEDNEEVAEVKEKKPLQRVVATQPKKVKRGLLSRLVTGVIGPDGLPGIGTYVNDEIIKPAIKNIVFDALTSAARMALFKDGGGPHTGGLGNVSRRPTNYKPSVNYQGRYREAPPEPARDRIVSRSSRFGVEEYVIDDRYDASNVLTTLTENADRYDVTSVADYYDLIGVLPQHTDHNYGWTIDSITRATILPVRGGYVIKFPPVEEI